MSGVLYLVPNLLGAAAPSAVLPQRTIDVARGLARWAVETPKAARAFLNSLGMPVPLARLDIAPLPRAPGAAGIASIVALLRSGEDVGLLSDAGCPGVADPGAALVAAAHAAGVTVVPLVGPSAILLALMASGLNGQRFSFHGYLPVKPGARADALRALEAQSRAGGRAETEIFIETPYRNAAMLGALAGALKPSTIVCIAADLTLPTESIERAGAHEWGKRDATRFDRRPAIFLLQAADSSSGQLLM
ncbi:MAG: SAM-dependent methyltransferase [Betaproteobacteria bacterium]|nr:SAM-dependent methyltransferase [Betaproteobacteria bacterium]